MLGRQDVEQTSIMLGFVFAISVYAVDYHGLRNSWPTQIFIIVLSVCSQRT